MGQRCKRSHSLQLGCHLVSMLQLQDPAALWLPDMNLQQKFLKE